MAHDPHKEQRHCQRDKETNQNEAAEAPAIRVIIEYSIERLLFIIKHLSAQIFDSPPDFITTDVFAHAPILAERTGKEKARVERLNPPFRVDY